MQGTLDFFGEHPKAAIVANIMAVVMSMTNVSEILKLVALILSIGIGLITLAVKAQEWKINKRTLNEDVDLNSE